MSRVIVPRAPGHFCAFGMLFADLRYDLVRTWFTRLADVSFDEIERVYAELIEDGRRSLAASGIASRSVAVARSADMRYVGQEAPGDGCPPPDVFKRRSREGLKRRFDEEHLQRYGTNAPEEPAEIVSLRATVTGAMKNRRSSASRAAGARPRLQPGAASAVPTSPSSGRPSHADLHARGAALRQPHRRPGARRRARLDHGPPAWRPAAR